MKVLVIGATGLTGKLAMQLLLDRGDEVTALARDPKAFEIKHERLRVAKGEARDRASLLEATRDQDAVLSAFGPRDLRKKDDLQEVFMKNLVAAMHETGTKRLSNLSAWGAGDSYGELTWFAKMVLRAVLADLFADKERGEVALFASELDYVNVRPGRLSNGPARGGVKASLSGADLKWWPFMTRADLAAFMVESLTATEWVQKSPLIGYGKN